MKRTAPFGQPTQTWRRFSIHSRRTFTANGKSVRGGTSPFRRSPMGRDVGSTPTRPDPEEIAGPRPTEPTQEGQARKLERRTRTRNKKNEECSLSFVSFPLCTGAATITTTDAKTRKTKGNRKNAKFKSLNYTKSEHRRKALRKGGERKRGVGEETSVEKRQE